MASKNEDLDNLLKQDSPPERSESYWISFPKSLMTRLERPANVSMKEDKRSYHRFPKAFALGLGLGLACLILAVKHNIGSQSDQHPAIMANIQQAKSYARIISEVGEMFPNRVRSVTLEENSIQLDLADQADVANSPPIWLEVCLGGRCRKFITFSGQQVGVDGDLYDVLVDSVGNVMLTSDKMIWSSADQTSIGAGTRISAHLL